MLKAIGVTKTFGALKAVDNLSFELEEGQILGIAGPNGAGKSTVFNLISGFYSYEGTIKLKGRNLAGMRPHQVAKAGISRTFQVPQIFPSLTVKESISVGSRFGTSRGLDSDHVDKTIEFVGLNEKYHQNTNHLNLLDKKKLMMGAALATKPKILMLDEPMGGCNAREIRQLMELITQINQALGISIIIIEHFMKVLTELTEKLLIIEAGAEICFDTPEKAVSNPKVIECYLEG